MEQPQTSTPDVIKCRWDAYKTTGKWYAGQEIDVPRSLMRQPSAAILAHVRDVQTQIDDRSFGGFHHVVRETDAQMADPAYTGFMHRLIFAQES